jgi:hypothetical protein
MTVPAQGVCAEVEARLLGDVQKKNKMEPPLAALPDSAHCAPAAPRSLGLASGRTHTATHRGILFSHQRARQGWDVPSCPDNSAVEHRSLPPLSLDVGWRRENLVRDCVMHLCTRRCLRRKWPARMQTDAFCWQNDACRCAFVLGKLALPLHNRSSSRYAP